MDAYSYFMEIKSELILNSPLFNDIGQVGGVMNLICSFVMNSLVDDYLLIVCDRVII